MNLKYVAILIKPLWTVARVNIKPEHRIRITHVRADFALSIVARYLGVTLAFADLADNFRLKILDHTVTSDIKPKKVKKIHTNF